MDAFFKYVKEPHVLQDFKNTFDLSAKFRHPQPSQTQRTKFFQEEFNVIFQKFYQYLRKNSTLPGKDDAQVQFNLKNKVDQSDLLIEFDAWLEQDGNQFSLNEKQKTINQQPMHSSFSIPSPAPNNKNNQYTPSAPIITPVARTVQNKIINVTTPFNIEKNPPPPSPLPTAKNLASLGSYQPPAPIQPPAPRPTLYPPSMQYMPAPIHKADDKEKPYKTRLFQKLSEYMDCPQRYCIIKAELVQLLHTQRRTNT